MGNIVTFQDDLSCCAFTCRLSGLGHSHDLWEPAAGQQVLHLLGLPRIWADDTKWQRDRAVQQHPLLAGVRPHLSRTQVLQPLGVDSSQVHLYARVVLAEERGGWRRL